MGCGGFIMYGHSCTRRESSGKLYCAWRNVPTTPRSRSSPTMPLGRRGSALARCLLLASTWRKASHATRQTSAVLRCSAWAKIRVLPAESMPLGPSGCWGTRIKPWHASTRPWRWHTSCRIPIVWRMHGVGRPSSLSLRRDVPAVHEHAEAAVALSTEQGFPLWVALGTSLRGWALAMQGQSEEGMAQVRQGIAAWLATGAVVAVPYFYTLLADVCCPSGPHRRRPSGAGRGPHSGGAA